MAAINTAWVNNLVDQINAVPDCNTLQQAIDKVIAIINEQLAQLQRQIEELALMIIPVTNLTQVLDFIKKQIAFYQAQYLQALAMQAALMAAYAQLINAINAKIAALHCSIAPLTLPVAPTISVQPASQSVSVDDSVTFSVTASGTPPLTYQWYKGSTPIDLAITSSYTIPSAQVSDDGNYSVKVRTVAGGITSSTATLTVT